MRSRIYSWLDEFYYLVSLQVPLFLITGIDYIVHAWLYDHGLKFSYSWAIPYWIFLSLTFISLGFLGVAAYNIDRKRWFLKAQKQKLFAIFITLIGEYFGGFLDTIWMGIRALTGKGINWSSDWSWSFFSKIFGHWDLRMNLVLNLIVSLLLIILWLKVNKR